MKRPSIILPSKSPQTDRRLQMMIVLVLGVFSILVFRLWTIQIYRHDDYVKESLNNRRRPIPVQSQRGEIRDRNGKPLAKDVNYRDVWLPLYKSGGRPFVNADIRRALELLSKILERPYAVLEKEYQIGEQNKQLQVRVAERIPPQKYEALVDHWIEFPEKAMIFCREVPTRYYRYGDFAAHILGFTGPIEANEQKQERFLDYAPYSQIGKKGLEKQYEPVLHGTDGLDQIFVDTHEIQRGPAEEVKPTVPGDNLVLTLDYYYQLAAEQILGASRGVIIMADPRDNSILAMASSPRYDINDYHRRYKEYSSDSNSPFLHRAIQGLYEPGSVFKIFETFALLEEEHIDPYATVFCPGHFSKWGGTWKCDKKTGHGYVNLYDAICMSCNVYFYEMAGDNMIRKDGGKRLLKWAHEFGLTDKTGIDLPEENVASYFPSKETAPGWTPGVGISNAIGQGGVLFTPLQVSTAACAIANGGTLYQPHLVQKIISPDGIVKKTIDPIAVGTIEASTKTFEIVRKGMWEVVNNPRGTGRRIKDFKNFILAGKTGTAQAGMDPSKTHAWLVCYGPFEKPEIVITIMLEYGGHGGEACSPLMNSLLDVYLGNVSIEDLV